MVNLSYYSYFKDTSFTWERTGGDPITQGNRNPLLYKNIGADGIKTGFFVDISVVSILGMGISWYLLRYFK